MVVLLEFPNHLYLWFGYSFPLSRGAFNGSALATQKKKKRVIL